jgi:hypothetical protein
VANEVIASKDSGEFQDSILGVFLISLLPLIFSSLLSQALPGSARLSLSLRLLSWSQQVSELVDIRGCMAVKRTGWPR